MTRAAQTVKIPQHNRPDGTWCPFSGCDSLGGICRMCEPEPEAVPASTPVASPTAVCRDCGKPIRRNVKGYWGARKRLDPHPWHCGDSANAGKRHEPVQAA